MTTPQQPELARSERSAVSPASAKARSRRKLPPDEATLGPLPEDNLPGHHPPVEQDKPTDPPAQPPRHHRFRFRRDRPFALASALVGASNDDRAYVDVDDEQLRIRYGRWSLTTTMDNVAGAEVTGPYRWWKVIGLPHLSLRDGGITFATTATRGVCIRFREPVAAALPHGLLRHPAATVTVDEPDDLVRFIEG